MIGYLTGDAIETISNQLYINNGAGFPLIFGDFASRYVNINKVGIGFNSKVVPGNSLEINSAIGGSGLRFTNIKSTNTPVNNPSNGVLSVDPNGDVILVYDKLGTGGTGTTTNTLTSSANTLTSTVNGVVASAPAVNTVVNTITGNDLVTTVNGVSSSSIALPTYTDTDAQTLTLTGNTLSISNGNNVTLCNIYNCDGTLTGNRTVTMSNNNLIFNTSGGTGGRIYVGNTTAFTSANFPTSTGDYRLYVEGGILTEKVKVAMRNTTDWMDSVFAKEYQLTPLNEVEKYIKENKHLPGVESAETLVKEGLDLGDMQAKQMGKIEELTLYTIEQQKQLDQQAKEIEELKAQLKALLEKR